MFRAYFVIMIMHFCLVFQGCTVLEKLDGSTEEELQKFKMSKDEIWNEMQRLKGENENLTSQLSLLEQENERSRELINQTEELKRENEELRNERLELEKRLSQLELQEREPEEESSAPEDQKDIGELRIKVLSGDGQISSARQMAVRLREMGYEVELIDLAPRSNFIEHTVYFAPTVEEQANDLATNLAAGTILKPLSWSSEFDLILVTGGHP